MNTIAITDHDLRDQLTVAETREIVRGIMQPEREEDTSWTVCVGGILHLARRMRDACHQCGQSIDSGAVGLATWCDERQHAVGGWSHQHGCGAWNSPTEVETALGDAMNDGDYEAIEQRVFDALEALDRECF
jgi:hypothetical protein